MKLRSKIFLPLASLVLVLGLYINLLWAPTIVELIKQKEIDNIAAHLKSVSDGLIPLLLENQLANVYDNLDSIMESNANWTSLHLRNQNNQLLYPLKSTSKQLLTQYQVVVRQDIRYEDHKLGSMNLVVDFSHEIEEFIALKNQMLLFFLLAVAVFILGIKLVLRYVIHKPLSQLADVFDKLARGDFDIPLPKGSKDEIGHLIKRADEMRNAVQKYQSQLRHEINDHKVTADALFEEKERVSYHATHDSLTDLVNRREFEARLKIALQTAHKHEHEHALLYLDLDQFKVVNDTCGHVAGDALLKQLSVILKKQLRSGDTLARLGGDEFGVLLENCDIKHANFIAHSLLETVQEFHFEWQGNPFRIGVSIGLIPIIQSSASIEALLSNADAACYAAKDLGRNRVYEYHHDDQDIAQRSDEMQWITRINKALDENRFVLYCQPVIKSPVPSHEVDPSPVVEVEYGEILVRMIGDDGDHIPPGAFLPAAERYNMISHIDFWVIEAVFRYLHELDTQAINLAINISGSTLSDNNLLPFVKRCLDQYKVVGEQLCFEITETAAVSDLKAANTFIRELKKFGCKFALDDFGRGLSSLVYLKNFEVDYLKIDGLFVKDINHDPIDFAMIRSINDISHLSGMVTIAEFVESEEIYDKLVSIDVDCMQGYWISKPYPLTEHKERLKTLILNTKK